MISPFHDASTGCLLELLKCDSVICNIYNSQLSCTCLTTLTLSFSVCQEHWCRRHVTRENVCPCVCMCVCQRKEVGYNGKKARWVQSFSAFHQRQKLDLPASVLSEAQFLVYLLLHFPSLIFFPLQINVKLKSSTSPSKASLSHWFFMCWAATPPPWLGLSPFEFVLTTLCMQGCSETLQGVSIFTLFSLSLDLLLHLI